MKAPVLCRLHFLLVFLIVLDVHLMSVFIAILVHHFVVS